MPYLVTQDGPELAPYFYTLAPGEEFVPSAISATWDGSGAAGSFLACLSIYAPSGQLVGRVFPDTVFAAGDDGEVTYAPFLRQAQAQAPAAAAIYPGAPATIDLFDSAASGHDSLNFGTVTVDARVRHNAYLASSGADGDYFTRLVTLGPKGSLWALVISFATAPDGGNLNYRLASVASPNPNRAGVNDAGTLTDDPLTYILLSSDDTYTAAFTDAGHNGVIPFRITGVDGAPFTAFLGANDPYTGFRQIDGGAGVYALKVLVNGKNGASAGFNARITSLAFVRLNDSGFF